jgi:hypothetical protein
VLEFSAGMSILILYLFLVYIGIDYKTKRPALSIYKNAPLFLSRGMIKPLYIHKPAPLPAEEQASYINV